MLCAAYFQMSYGLANISSIAATTRKCVYDTREQRFGNPILEPEKRREQAGRLENDQEVDTWIRLMNQLSETSSSLEGGGTEEW